MLYTQINHITLINVVTQFAMFSFKPLECSGNITKFPNVVMVYINIPCNTVYCYSSIQYLGWELNKLANTQLCYQNLEFVLLYLVGQYIDNVLSNVTAHNNHTDASTEP